MIDHGPAASAVDIKAFITTVGERVRQSRQQMGISRRAVSELSGVSQRYLAQLEGGDGNISIALLYKVAHALGRNVAYFVGSDSSSDVDELSDLLRTADTGQLRKIRDILKTEHNSSTRQRRISLVGVRGAGKSTLGVLVANALGMPFVELNSEIAEQSGMPVDELIELYGQDGFRQLERQALQQIVSTHADVVVAVAGGIVSEPDAYNFLLENFHTIWLKATPEEHMSRVRAQGDYRPMSGNPKAMEELRAMLRNREALYERANHSVSTSDKTVAESGRDVLGVIGRLGISPIRLDK